MAALSHLVRSVSTVVAQTAAHRGGVLSQLSG